MKMIFILFLILLLFICHVMKSVFHFVYVKISQEMIDLMAERACQKPLALQFKFFHLFVERPYLYDIRTGHNAPFSRNT